MNAPRPARTTRDADRHLTPLATRWADDDVYGHVDDVVDYAFFDTVINRYLIESGGLDIHAGPVIGLCVSSGCVYHAPVAYPDALEGALRAAHLGRSSVRYEVGVFHVGDALSAAGGHFMHVFVDRATRRPTPIPPALAAALAAIDVSAPAARGGR